MSGYKAEQEMELEALEAILSDDLTEEAERPSADWPTETSAYRIKIRVAEELSNADSQKNFDFVFAHTPNYPEEAPRTKVSSVLGLSGSELAEVEGIIASEIEANMGMAMIYTVVCALKEWLENQVAGVNETGFEVSPEELEKQQRELEERRLAEARAQGTPVTVETFTAWRQKFLAEKQSERAQLDPDGGNKEKGPTGKLFFLAQDTSGIALEDEEEEDEDYEGSEDSGYTEEDLDDDVDEDELIEELLARKAG